MFDLFYIRQRVWVVVLCFWAISDTFACTRGASLIFIISKKKLQTCTSSQGAMSLPCEMGCRREETDAVDTTLLQMSDVGPDMKSEDHVNVIRGDCRDVDVDERTDFVADCHTAVVVDVRQRGVMNECNRTIDDYLGAMDKNREKDMNSLDELFMSGRGGMGIDAVVHHKSLREELDDRVKKTAYFKVAAIVNSRKPGLS